MDFTKRAIKVAVEATIAEGTGLAYHPAVTPSVQGGYAVTHLASGRVIYDERYPLLEWTVQAWIKRLALLADWTRDAEGMRSQATASLRRAIDAALDEALEECPGDYVLTTRRCVVLECGNFVTYDHFPYCSECGGDTCDHETEAEVDAQEVSA